MTPKTNAPQWDHEPIADDEIFLGTWVEGGRPVDLYFRPKPSDMAFGFCHAVVARWGAYKNDFRVGEAKDSPLKELQDEVDRAMRIGRLIAVDRGLLDE